MKTIINIRNMVCDRCKSTVQRELSLLGYQIDSVELGQITFNKPIPRNQNNIVEVLKKLGFEVIRDQKKVLVEQIKISLIQKIRDQDNTNLSIFMTKAFNQSYSSLSNMFSRSEGITIEKYEINLKIEKVKELIQLGQLNFSEIAYSLNYNNSSHLARQFKNVTGMSMTNFKNLKNWKRKSLDQIV